MHQASEFVIASCGMITTKSPNFAVFLRDLLTWLPHAATPNVVQCVAGACVK